MEIHLLLLMSSQVDSRGPEGSVPVSVRDTMQGPAPRLTPRVSQLRQEECVDLVGREAAQERELHSTMQMSQSWEDLTLVPSPTGAACKTGGDQTDGSRKVMNRVMEPIHLTLPLCSPMCSSPSPTRSGLGRQCFSPGMHHVWKSGLSPSPTRKAFATRRSQSPIAMRQSSLGPVKRKFDLEEEKADQYISPPTKRPNCFGSDRGGLLMAQNNMLDTASSPLPGSLSSGGTPESLSSADSPGFTFRPLDSPSPGRPIISSSDEPMQEEIPKQDQIMTSVEASENKVLGMSMQVRNFQATCTCLNRQLFAAATTYR
uniref:Uncharacterized protein n=1 Tax=Timema cristinae TaxID=61476 RepID=A0A7R9GQ92_TIMCR|nr:unnamed protein product [Timema cristinae]